MPVSGKTVIVEPGERFFEMKIATLSFLPGGISNSVAALKLQKLLQRLQGIKATIKV
jgi:hypothetical protein